MTDVIIDKERLISYIESMVMSAYQMGFTRKGVKSSGAQALKDSIQNLPLVEFNPTEFTREEILRVLIGSLDRNEAGVRSLVRRISQE